MRRTGDRLASPWTDHERPDGRVRRGKIGTVTPGRVAPMHSLYWRIFLAFWLALALILVGTVTVALNVAAQRRVQLVPLEEPVR